MGIYNIYTSYGFTEVVKNVWVFCIPSLKTSIAHEDSSFFLVLIVLSVLGMIVLNVLLNSSLV